MNISFCSGVQIYMNKEGIHLPSPDPRHPYPGDGRYRFPDIEGLNLLGDRVSLPTVIPGSFHLMLCVFQPESLYMMKEWLPFCDDLHKQYRHTPAPVDYSMVLVLPPPPIEGDVPAFTQALGDVSDFYVKTGSVISYHDQAFVRRRLSLHKKAASAVVLLDGHGNIIWKDDGEFTTARAEHLKVILETLAPLAPRTRLQ